MAKQSADDFLGPATTATVAQGGGSADDFLGAEPAAATAQAPATPSSPAPIPPFYTPRGMLRHEEQLLGATGQGLAGGIGMFGDLQNLASKYLPDNLQFLNWPLKPHQQVQGSADLEKAAGDFGHKLMTATGQGDVDLTPQNTLERLGTGAARGVGASLPLLAMGVPPVAGLAAGAGGGVGSELGAMATPGSQVGPIVGGLLGGGVGQGTMQVLGRQGLEKIAGALGGPLTKQQAGRVLQEGASDWLKNTHPQLQSEAWAPVDAAIAPTTKVALPQFAQTLNSLKTPAGALQPVSDVLGSNMAGKLSEAYNTSTVGVGAQPSWADVKALRTQLGDAMSNPMILKDLPRQQVSKLYAGLTSDMRTAAHANGAGDAFDAANEESKRLFGIAEGPMSKVVNDADLSKNTLNPEDVASRLLSAGKKGGTDLEALRTNLPDGVDALAAAHLSEANSTFHKLSPEAQSALIDNPKLRSAAITGSKQAAGQSLKDAVANPLHSLVGEGFGEALGTHLGHYFDYAENSLLPPETGRMVGLLAPQIYHGALKVGNNPEIMMGPGQGLAAGLIAPSPADKPRM